MQAVRIKNNGGNLIWKQGLNRLVFISKNNVLLLLYPIIRIKLDIAVYIDYMQSLPLIGYISRRNSVMNPRIRVSREGERVHADFACVNEKKNRNLHVYNGLCVSCASYIAMLLKKYNSLDIEREICLMWQ